MLYLVLFVLSNIFSFLLLRLLNLFLSLLIFSSSSAHLCLLHVENNLQLFFFEKKTDIIFTLWYFSARAELWSYALWFFFLFVDISYSFTSISKKISFSRMVDGHYIVSLLGFANLIELVSIYSRTKFNSKQFILNRYCLLVVLLQYV